MKSNLLVEAIRGNIQEKRFYGWAMVVDNRKKILRSLEIPDYICFMRSCEKPIQAKVALESGIVNKYNLTSNEIAISYSSHVGSSLHIELLKKLHLKIGINQDDLICGIHPPIDKQERLRLLKNDESPTQLHNNCSGKHTFLLAACIANGWDTKSYNNQDHPAQKRINQLIKEYCNPEELHFGYDGCDLPVHGMKLSEMGAGFAKYFMGNTSEAEIIADAVTQNPVTAGGEGRIDTVIIQVTKGNLIAKVGAEGLIIVTPRHSGEALVIKSSSGDNEIRNLVVIEALRQLNWISQDHYENPLLKPYITSDIVNFSNRKVGYYKFNFKI